MPTVQIATNALSEGPAFVEMASTARIGQDICLSASPANGEGPPGGGVRCERFNGRSRRKAPLADRGLGRLNWAESDLWPNGRKWGNGGRRMLPPKAQCPPEAGIDRSPKESRDGVERTSKALPPEVTQGLPGCQNQDRGVARSRMASATSIGETAGSLVASTKLLSRGVTCTPVHWSEFEDRHWP